MFTIILPLIHFMRIFCPLILGSLKNFPRSVEQEHVIVSTLQNWSTDVQRVVDLSFHTYDILTEHLLQVCIHMKSFQILSELMAVQGFSKGTRVS